eukprot:TRINITY_DN3924_c0_g1_i2.p1 TRINITY_DN3924_c0_g1~~TRINITY_DN3924_c0_g1_i2.p1  ORF type:complete len:1006 (-),score=130.86 TRINITY_DN3924_c0_g1_i2:8-3025(-)
MPAFSEELLEEIDALSAIFGSSFLWHKETCQFRFEIDCTPRVILSYAVPQDYPSFAPSAVSVELPAEYSHHAPKLEAHLLAELSALAGSVVGYALVEAVQAFTAQLPTDPELTAPPVAQPDTIDANSTTVSDHSGHTSQDFVEGYAEDDDVGLGRYPSTPHFPFSPGVNDDDGIQSATELGALTAEEVVITEKLDGGNCCICNYRVYARTHGQEASHASFGPIKQLIPRWEGLLEPGLAIFGENMTGIHSITYGNLTSFLYIFGARRKNGEWLSWDDVTTLAQTLGVPTVPLVFRGRFSSAKEVETFLVREAARPSRVGDSVQPEGFVMRVTRGWNDAAFTSSIAKYVRKDHIQTDASWRRTWKKAQLGPASKERPVVLQDGGPKPRPKTGTGTAAPPPAEPKAAGKSSLAPGQTLFCDLDGVLADFVAKVVELFGPEGEQMIKGKPREFWAKVGKIDGGGKSGFYDQLPWMPDGKKLWAEISSLEPAPVILTGLPRADWAAPQKKKWCARELGPVTVVTCMAKDKPRYCEGPSSILIDDNADTGVAWTAAGGTFILHTSADETIRQLRKLLSGPPKVPKSKESTPGPVELAKPRERPRAAKPFPQLLMLIGLPGSGKSTFAAQLEAALSRNGLEIVRVSQDEIGNRDGCAQMLGNAAKKASCRVILDRCNVDAADRKQWLELAFRPKSSCAIFFDLPTDECKARVQRRTDHPTIPHGRGGVIVDGFAKRLEPPTLKEGFAEVYCVRSFAEADSLLRSRFGVEPDLSLIPEGAEVGLFKFPRTAHLINAGAATRDDLVQSAAALAEWFGKSVTVEEKVDGANLGISLTKDYRPQCQNRSHYVTSESHTQFRGLDEWLAEHGGDLCSILEPERHILFGEWLLATHSIHYTRLPDRFLAFDIYDRTVGKFLAVAARDALLATTSLHCVPCIASKRTFKSREELLALLDTTSQFYDGPVEGVYLRIDDANDEFHVQRAKIVRPDFIQGMDEGEHWTKKKLQKNGIVHS